MATKSGPRTAHTTRSPTPIPPAEQVRDADGVIRSGIPGAQSRRRQTMNRTGPDS
jgi:hypothetical protein